MENLDSTIEKTPSLPLAHIHHEHISDVAIPICIQSSTDGSLPIISLCNIDNDESQQNPPFLLPYLTEENSVTHNRVEEIFSFNNDFQKIHQETPLPSVQCLLGKDNYNNLSFTPGEPFLQSAEAILPGNSLVNPSCSHHFQVTNKDGKLVLNLLNNTATDVLWNGSIDQKMAYNMKLENYDDVTDSEKDVPTEDVSTGDVSIEDVPTEDVFTEDFPTADSVQHIVSYIKNILAKVYGSDFRKEINSIEVKFQDECHLNSFLELFLPPLQKKSVLQKEIIRKKKCPVPKSFARKKGKLFAKLEGLKMKIKKKVVEKTPKRIMYNESLNKKISSFFPKLMTKIASKSDRLVEKTLTNKQSLFIVSCTAKLAWKFNNSDAFALFKLSALEIERGNFSQAVIYYKQARISLSEMIFHDKVFSFLFNGKTESTIIKEIPHSEAKYFSYRQTNIALMNDQTIFSFAFDETDHTKLNSTEIDGAEAIKSLKFLTLEELEKVATRFTLNLNEENKK